ncbi:MAG: gliding motility-associated ABC transporter substrate-binding protein GldG [Bacteroidales bacterium]|nr:gliding motility-associated ABC transporter substrate-binding protein GldG [Bacteroidales bacterium]
MTEVKKNNKQRKRSILTLLISLFILISINLLGSLGFYRVDLTQEKRYTLSDNTIELLKSLDDIVYFQILLEGELPAAYQKLRNSIQETLDEFRAYNKTNIQYEFIDPAEGKDKKILNDYYNELTAKGLEPVIDYEVSGQGDERKILWPCAIVNFKSRETIINFVSSSQQMDKEVLINESLESLEFNLIDAIRRLTIKVKPSVAFIEGHGEADAMRTDDITRSLEEYYNISRLAINHQLKALNDFKTIIIAGPDSAFDEKDKFIIDQFIMKGGNVLWLIDGTQTNMDSLQAKSETVAIANDLNLDDMLFKYGVRINPDLLMDLNSCPIPVKTGQVGNQPQFDFFNWYYFPSVSNLNGHPIVKNLNALRFEFVSSIDTVYSAGIKKTVLLSTSEYTRILNSPAIISLRVLQEEPSKRLFKNKEVPVAVLLEGKFNSVFANRIPPEIADNPEIGFKETGENSRMIVVSDGDIIQNQFQMKNGQFFTYPLGYDRFTGITYGNKDFILNCLNYLTDDSDLLSIRSRELKIRLLDKARISENKFMIQLANVVYPVLSIAVFGFILVFLRKRRIRKL